MYSNQLDFFKFINHLIELDDGKYYDTITNISSSNGPNPKPLIESNIKILNLEGVILDYFKGSSPAIVDGLYFNFNKFNKLSLFFVEFKGDKLNKKALKGYFKENICSLKDNVCDSSSLDCPILLLNQSELENIYTHFEDEESVQLRNKPFESILIGIPELFRDFYNYDSVSHSFLTEYYICHIYVVYVGSIPNSSNTHLTVKQEIEAKYASYQNNGIITDYKTISDIDFNENYLPKIQSFPIHFLKNILCIIEDLKENRGMIDSIDDAIDEKLDFELDKEGLFIDNQQKKRLHKVIYHHCNN